MTHAEATAAIPGVRRAWEEATTPNGPIELIATITDDTGHRWAIGNYKEILP